MNPSPSLGEVIMQTMQRIPTLDQLITEGHNWGCDVAAIVKRCDEMRKEHRYYWNGFTKNRSHRFTHMIPRFVQDSHPELKKFFDNRMDRKEKRKNEEKFLALYPEFLVVNNYGRRLKIA